jgi:hypothetical protein
MFSWVNILVYIYVQNDFVIDQVVLKLFIKRLAVAMVNKAVVQKKALLDRPVYLQNYAERHCFRSICVEF